MTNQQHHEPFSRFSSPISPFAFPAVPMPSVLLADCCSHPFDSIQNRYKPVLIQYQFVFNCLSLYPEFYDEYRSIERRPIQTKRWRGIHFIPIHVQSAPGNSTILMCTPG